MSGAACWLPAVPMISPGHQVRTLQDSGKAAPRRHTHCSEARRSKAESKLRLGLELLSSDYVLFCADKPDSSRPANFGREKQKSRFVIVVESPSF